MQTSVQAASEDAIRALQAALPLGLSQVPTPVQLENVKPTLLLPPTEKRGIASELAGGIFELGDRVACLIDSGKELQEASWYLPASSSLTGAVSSIYSLSCFLFST